MITGYVVVNGYFGTDSTQASHVVEATLPTFFDEVIKTNMEKEFFLFGSRSMVRIEKDDKNSDWDFAVDESVDIEGKLLKVGFIQKTDIDNLNYYLDATTVAVYEKVYEEGKVQVVVKTNLELFKTCWLNITQQFWSTFINKRSDRYLGKQEVCALFNLLHSIAEDVKNSLLTPIEEFM